MSIAVSSTLSPRALDAQTQTAAVEGLGRQIAEHNIGVGHRRLFAAQIVGSGARHRTSALRADLDPPGGPIEAGDGAAARADRARLEHRDPDLPTVDERPRPVRARPAALDDAHVETGAAHVGENQIFLAQFTADESGAQQAGHRPAVDGLDGARLAHFRHAAARVDHHNGSRVAPAVQFVAGAA